MTPENSFLSSYMFSSSCLFLFGATLFYDIGFYLAGLVLTLLIALGFVECFVVLGLRDNPASL